MFLGTKSQPKTALDGTEYELALAGPIQPRIAGTRES